MAIINAGAVDGLASFKDGSVHCCVTSPPYWGLRDYGVDGQIGLEATVEEYVAKLVDVFRAVRRVLRDDGTLWLNLGDTYMGGRNGGMGEKSQITSSRNHDAARAAWKASGGRTHRRNPGLKPKDLVGVPWRVALALQVDGWWLRSEIIWHKPTAMPEAVKDRPTRAHEQVFLLSKSRKYYYDADAIKVPASKNSHPRGDGVTPKSGKGGPRVKNNPSFGAAIRGVVEMRNKRSVWTIPQEPFSEAHFSTYPTKLVEPCVLAGCPAGGVVLDPFGGAGTTAIVAERLGRDSVLIDLNPDYCRMARERIERDSPLFAQVEEA